VTVEDDAYELSNVVETALARALTLAAEAKRWDMVSLIARELQRRDVIGCARADGGRCERGLTRPLASPTKRR